MLVFALPLLLCCCFQCLKGDKHASAAAVTLVVALHVLLNLLVSAAYVVDAAYAVLSVCV